jgi:hypothetical protein
MTRMPKIESQLTRREALSGLAKVRRKRPELGEGPHPPVGCINELLTGSK